MNVSIENKGPLGRRITVTLDNHSLEEVVSSQLFELSKTASLKGFRPGKVPSSLIQKKWAASVRTKALEELVKEHAPSVIEQKEFQVAGPLFLEQIKELPDKTIEYSFNFEIYPKIELMDLSQIELEKWSIDITDADIDAEVERLKKNNISDTSEEDASNKEKASLRLQWIVSDAIDSDIKEKVLAMLLEQYNVELPMILLQKEYQAFIQEERAAQDKHDLEPKEIEALIKKRASLGLLVTQYVVQRNLKVTPELIDQEIKERVQALPQAHLAESIKSAFYASKELLASLENKILLDLVIDSVLNEVKIVEVKRTLQDLEIF